MIHTGIGHRQVTSFLSVMNIKSPHHDTVKAMEREVGQAIEKVARDSVSSALQVRID